MDIIKTKQKVFIFFVFLFSLCSYAWANQLSSRASQSVIELQALSPQSMTLSLNSINKISVKIISNTSNVSGITVKWTLAPLNSDGNISPASFTNGGGSSTSSLTDIDGVASISVNAGSNLATYKLTATVTINLGDYSNDISRDFVFNVGLQASLQLNTPQYHLAVSINNVCLKLAQNAASLTQLQSSLLAGCTAIKTAITDGKTTEVGNALRQLSPEEVGAQSDIARSFNTQQMTNIISRLNAVHFGVARLSFSNLNYNYNGRSIPLGYIFNSLLRNDQKSVEKGSLLSNRVGIFANGNLNSGSRLTSTNESGFSFDSYAFTMGADYRLDSNRFVGTALGLSKSGVNVSQDGGNLDGNGLTLSVYANQYLSDKWYIDGVLNLGLTRFSMKRNINYTLSGNTVNRVASSNTQGLQQGFLLRTGYDIHDGALGALFTGSVSYNRMTIDKFRESGAQELDLSISGQNISSTKTKLGGNIRYTHSSSIGVIIPYIGFYWVHEFSGTSNVSGTMGVDQYISNFSFKTDKPDSDYFTNVQGINVVLPHGFSAYFRFENTLSQTYYKLTNVTLGGRMELDI